MRKLTAAIALGIVAVAVAIPASPAQAAGIKQLAKQECRIDRADEPAEFQARYGSGSDAIKRCAKAERREARVDCRQDRVEEPSEFAMEYGGTDRAAIKRCIRDELV